MLMRSNAQFSGGMLKPRETDPAHRLIVRERVMETAEWTVCVPSIETLSVSSDARTGLRATIWSIGALLATAGGLNSWLALVTPTLPVLVAAVVACGLCLLLGLRLRSIHELMVTSNDGAVFTVTSAHRTKLDEVHAFVAEKINRQDLGARHVFNLDGRDDEELGSHALGVDEALRAIAEGGPAAREASPSPGALNDNIDYARVLPQITEMHRFYESRDDDARVRERLSELELLMRSGTPAAQQQLRVRELALDLSNLLASSPPVARFFAHISRTAAR